MSTDGAAADSAPARIVFPSLRASGPASEQAGYTEGHAAGYAAGVRAAAKEQRRWRDRMTAEQAASLAAGQQDLDRAVRALAVARDGLRTPERPGTARRRGGPGPHRAGTRRGHPGLRTGRGHQDGPRRPGPRPVRKRRRHSAGHPAEPGRHRGPRQGRPGPARRPAAARGPVAQPRRRQGRIPAGLARREPRQRPGTRPRSASGRPGLGREFAGRPAMIAEWRPKGADYAAALRAAAPQRVGVVTSVMGLGLEVSGLDCALGDLVTVGSNPGLDAEVVAALDSSVRCMPLGRLAGVAAGDSRPGQGRHRPGPHRTRALRPRPRRPRPAHRRQGSARQRPPRADRQRSPERHETRPHRHAPADRRPGPGHHDHPRQGPAHGTLRRFRRREVVPALDDRPRHGRRGLGDRPRGGARP